MGLFVDLSGKRFTRLLIISRAPNKPNVKNAIWHYRCDCGRIGVVRGDSIKRGTQSCGCYTRERNSLLNTTHGLSKTAEYAIWQAMKKRCSDEDHPTFLSHGAKGITVCERWETSFENFYADMGQRPSKRHSIDRMNNAGNYEPENCRWATPQMQGRNTSRNRMVEIDGVSFCVADWCDLMGVDRHRPYTMLYWNKRSGITSVDEAIHQLYAEWIAG